MYTAPWAVLAVILTVLKKVVAVVKRQTDEQKTTTITKIMVQKYGDLKHDIPSWKSIWTRQQ